MRHSSPQVLTFLQVHGPQFIEILVDRHPFAIAVSSHRRILLHCGRIAVDESWFRRGRSGLLVDCIRFHRHIIIFFPIAKIRTFIEMTKTENELLSSSMLSLLCFYVLCHIFVFDSIIMLDGVIRQVVTAKKLSATTP